MNPESNASPRPPQPESGSSKLRFESPALGGNESYDDVEARLLSNLDIDGNKLLRQRNIRTPRPSSTGPSARKTTREAEVITDPRNPGFTGTDFGSTSIPLEFSQAQLDAAAPFVEQMKLDDSLNQSTKNTESDTQTAREKQLGVFRGRQIEYPDTPHTIEVENGTPIESLWGRERDEHSDFLDWKVMDHQTGTRYADYDGKITIDLDNPIRNAEIPQMGGIEQAAPSTEDAEESRITRLEAFLNASPDRVKTLLKETGKSALLNARAINMFGPYNYIRGDLNLREGYSEASGQKLKEIFNKIREINPKESLVKRSKAALEAIGNGRKQLEKLLRDDAEKARARREQRRANATT